MFWTYNTTSPQIDIILCKEELTLYELLDQENILQELKTQNLKLIEFISKPEILGELVDLITLEPSKELDEAEQYKYPNLACELLTSDLPALNERLVSEEILNKLYKFLQNDPPLNPLLSSYFSRTLSILISRKSEQNWYSYQYTCLQALEFLKAKEEFIELLLKHMGTSSIMDLMHNLVTLVEGPKLKEWLRSWLQTQNVIPSIISLLNPQSDVDCQVNAAAVLCSIIQKLRENMNDLNEDPESDPILNLLESSQTIELLLSTVFNCETLCETTIEGGIDVLLAIMQPYLPGDARCRYMLNFTVHDKIENIIPQNHAPEPGDVLNDIVKAILPFIKKLRDILRNPIKTTSITLTSGVISPPFGKARLLVTKLIAVLISLNNSEINKEIIHCDIPELLLDLFYAFSSNNFLHAEVEKLVAYAIDGMSNYTVTECNDDLFLTHMLKKCRLIQRMLHIWDENEKSEKEGNYRKGYMGFVIRIATLINAEDERNPAFHDLLSKEISSTCLNEWNEFVTNTLKVIIEKHTTCLGGVRPKLGQSSENSFEENIPGKELKSSYKEYDAEDDQNIMFSDDPSIIAYGEEGYNPDSPNNEDQMQSQTDLFNSICAQKWLSVNKGLNSLNDNDDEEGMRVFSWDDGTNTDTCLWGDSDDENYDEDTLNSTDPWSKLGGASNPWANSGGSGSAEDKNWANFEESFCDSQNNDCSDNMESCSTLATSVEQYSLFGNTRPNQSVSILSNFSNVKISPPQSNCCQFGESQLELNGDWSSLSDSPGQSNVEHEGNNDLQRVFEKHDSFERYDIGSSGANCERHDKNDENDRNDDIVNLELISGQTLAEKLANAENDIRYEDEFLMRGIKEQALRMMNNVNVVETSRSEPIQLANPICNVETCENSVKESDDHEGISAEQTCLSVKTTRPSEGNDCLTENSVDFVTAENSISDAESSTEFGDAENSLELEDDLAEKSELDNDIPGVQLIAEDQTSDENLSCCNSTPNVPNVDETTCNNIDSLSDTKPESDNVTESTETDQSESKICNCDSPTSLINGDLTESEKLAAGCDKSSKNTRENRGLNKEQIENMNRAIIDELA
ncbi:serine/threonine-protein phosphatase 6 regulatory subunit 3-B [Planococcus citri]|uniref:serine/threonine-protein phosphatase 6 regulatory subunit 3-B n=1 Tax=Planococcus citri TaxID=170843 RepID=UPI0031F842F1